MSGAIIKKVPCGPTARPCGPAGGLGGLRFTLHTTIGLQVFTKGWYFTGNIFWCDQLVNRQTCYDAPGYRCFNKGDK